MSYLSSKSKTISSLDIANRTGKEHKNVIRDIRNMFLSLKIDRLNFERIYFDVMNRKQVCYDLPKRESLILASGYDIVLRTKIIDRWIELESGSFNLPQTFSEALRMLADTKDREEKALLKLSSANQVIEENKPKVTFADSVVGSVNSVLVRQFAKNLCNETFRIGQNTLFKWFRDNNYLNIENEPYQKYINQGLFEVITRSVGSSYKTFTSRTTKITGKGQVYFAEKIKLIENV